METLCRQVHCAFIQLFSNKFLSPNASSTVLALRMYWRSEIIPFSWCYLSLEPDIKWVSTYCKKCDQKLGERYKVLVGRSFSSLDGQGEL